MLSYCYEREVERGGKIGIGFWLYVEVNLASVSVEKKPGHVCVG